MTHTNEVFLSRTQSSSVCESLRNLLSRECKDWADTIAIENAFKETTRDGKHILRFVRLALTSKAFVIAYEKEQASPSQMQNQLGDESFQELIKLYPWASITLSIFKRSKRCCVKVLFLDKTIRYFELQGIPKMKIYWSLWRHYIRELKESKKIWPFTNLSETADNNKIMNKKTHCIEIYVAKPKKKRNPTPKWTNKYLYLGSLRENEDKIRPSPVPGLGKTEDIKLLYLKSRYFGCWEQSEHWVQCGESSLEFVSRSNK